MSLSYICHLAVWIIPGMDAALNKGAHLPQHTRQQIQREDLEFFGQVTQHDVAGMGTQEIHSGNKNHEK